MKPLPSGQAQLASVGVTAKRQIETAFRQLVGDLRRVCEQHGERSLGNSLGGGSEIVSAVEMRVIDPRDPESFSVPFNRGGFV